MSHVIMLLLLNVPDNKMTIQQCKVLFFFFLEKKEFIFMSFSVQTVITWPSAEKTSQQVLNVLHPENLDVEPVHFTIMSLVTKRKSTITELHKSSDIMCDAILEELLEAVKTAFIK